MPEPSCNPKAVGEISEARVLTRLVELGYAVSIPFGNNQRYDMIVDDGEALTRAQVKTGRLESGSVGFPVRSVNGFTGEQRGYRGEADDFLVYCPEMNEIYRVPVAECGVSGRAFLRIEHSPNKSLRPHVRWAHEHILRQDSRRTRKEPLEACQRVHPDTPSRIKERPTSDGGNRRYCAECNRVWTQQARNRDKA